MNEFFRFTWPEQVFCLLSKQGLLILQGMRAMLIAPFYFAEPEIPVD